MSTCNDIQKELDAFLGNDIDEPQRSEIQEHLRNCRACAQAAQRLTRLSEVLQMWQVPEPSPLIYPGLKGEMDKSRSPWRRTIRHPFLTRAAFHIAEAAAVVILTLWFSQWLMRPTPEVREDSTIINLYLKEHQDVVAQTVSVSAPAPPTARMHVSPHDFLYYEFLDDGPEFVRPGIIVRTPSVQRDVPSAEPPLIANGHALTLSQARKAAGFDLVAPPRLHPGYMLDSIRQIEGRDALHLLYTDGVHTLSLFEQPLDGDRGLGPQDFREYAVYRREGQRGGTILAWRDHALSYVLIGNIEMTQLMDMAQSISASN
jgi:anti-sigma factor RsiW